MDKKKNLIILLALVITILIINYPWIDNSLEDFLTGKEQVFIDRVIDGDTIVSNKTSIRLLGINSPEKNEVYYEEAKSFLEDLVLNKSVELEFVGEKYDKYDRILGYIFINGKNINLKLVEQGFANYYFYSGRDIYSDDLEKAWDLCIINNVNLCKKSENVCASCIEIDSEKITNRCGFDCDINGWEMKGEGRDRVVLEGTLNPGEEKEFELDLSDTSGTLFLYDDNGGLVEWGDLEK